MRVDLGPYCAAALAGAGAAFLYLSFSNMRRTRSLIQEFEAQVGHLRHKVRGTVESTRPRD